LLNVNPTNLTATFTNAPSGGAASTGTNPIIVGMVRGGSDFIKDGAGALVAPTYSTAIDAASFTANANVTASLAANSGATVTSVRFNTGAPLTLTLSGANTITSGMILNTNAVATNTNTITGGSITSGNGQDVIIANFNIAAPGPMAMSSSIV